MMILAAFASGLVFGTGLVISGMVQPSKVLGFLDIFGAWDPTLAIVMAGALAVVVPGYALARRRGRPSVAAALDWPGKSAIDRPLVAGASLFGIGWGLVGLCPGPALVNIASLSPRILGFVGAMAIGLVARDLMRRRLEPRPQPTRA